MRILIAGAGIVGNNLAEELSEEGHDISIIDEDFYKIRRIGDTLDVMSICGNACDAERACKSRNSRNGNGFIPE